MGPLSPILQAAVEDGRLVKHPMKGSRTARPPAKPAQKARAWTREQAMRMRAGLPEQYRLAADLGVGLGLRQGEAFGLSPEDLDAENGVVHVRRQVCMIDGHLFFALPKGGKTREVDAAPASWPASRDTWNTRLWKPALASAGLIGKVDPDSDGSKWEPSREHGFHALRHTYASVQLEAGESIVSLARWLGHADPGFTLRTYTHFMPDAGTRGRAAMDAWFSGEANSLETP